MSASVRNLLIVLGILLAIVGYQILFTDTYEGLFGSPAPRITAEAPDIPTISSPGLTPQEPREVSDAPATEPQPEAAPPAPVRNGQFRSDQLLKDLPTENPFRALERQRSALFDPFANLPDSSLGNFDLAPGAEQPGALAEATGTGTASDSSAQSTVPSGADPAGAPAAPRTPQRLPGAPRAQLPEPAAAPEVFSPEFEPLFAPLATAPLITAVRSVAVEPDEIRLSHVPSGVLPELHPPRTTPPTVAPAAVAEHVAYFAPLPEFGPLAFSGAESLRARGAGSSSRVTTITNLGKYFSDIDITFTGTARGSVTVGVFRSNLALGPVVLAVGQTFPETDITLTRLTTTEAEFTLGAETRVLTLNLGW